MLLLSHSWWWPLYGDHQGECDGCFSGSPEGCCECVYDEAGGEQEADGNEETWENHGVVLWVQFWNGWDWTLADL